MRSIKSSLGGSPHLNMPLCHLFQTKARYRTQLGSCLAQLGCWRGGILICIRKRGITHNLAVDEQRFHGPQENSAHFCLYPEERISRERIENDKPGRSRHIPRKRENRTNWSRAASARRAKPDWALIKQRDDLKI